MKSAFFEAVDKLVARFTAQRAQLVADCKAAGLKRPVFVPPCVWKLRERTKKGVAGESWSFTDFTAAATFVRERAAAVERQRASAAAKKTEKKAAKSRRPSTPPHSTLR